MLALVFGLHSSGSLWRKERGIEEFVENGFGIEKSG